MTNKTLSHLKSDLLAEFDEKFGIVVKNPQKSNWQVEMELKRIREERDFLSSALDTVAEKTKEKITVGDRVLIDKKYAGLVEEIKLFPQLGTPHIEAVIKLDEKWGDGRTERVAIRLQRLSLKRDKWLGRGK